MDIFMTIIDHKIVSKILYEINHTLKQVKKLPRIEGDENNVSKMNS